MKSEFVRFGLKKFGLLTAILQILGAIGLVVGLLFNEILLISSGGLTILMFLGVAARLRIKDGLWATLPALFFLVLNAYIVFLSLKILMDSCPKQLNF